VLPCSQAPLFPQAAHKAQAQRTVSPACLAGASNETATTYCMQALGFDRCPVTMSREWPHLVYATPNPHSLKPSIKSAVLTPAAELLLSGQTGLRNRACGLHANGLYHQHMLSPLGVK
jgi:hypothetical protein